MLLFLVVLLHYIFIFSPVLLFLVPVNLIKKYFKFYFLSIVMVPILWGLNNNSCILTNIENGLDKENNQTFSKKHLKWLYKPIMKMLGLKWESQKDLDKMACIHWGFNYILLWIYLFHIHKCKLV
jgi:hypothetical protein